MINQRTIDKLIADWNNLDNLSFKQKLTLSTETGRVADQLKNAIGLADQNLENYGSVPEYKRHYELELVTLKTRVELLREVAPKIIDSWFPEPFPVSSFLENLK